MNHKGFGAKKWLCPCHTPRDWHRGNTGLGAGLALIASTQQSREHRKQRTGTITVLENKQVKSPPPAETDQSLPPTEHSTLRIPVLPPKQGLGLI